MVFSSLITDPVVGKAPGHLSNCLALNTSGTRAYKYKLSQSWQGYCNATSIGIALAYLWLLFQP